jgi:hypothetical protein
MPPRSYSTESLISIVSDRQWNDKDEYESENDSKTMEVHPLTKSVHFREMNEILLVEHIDEFCEEDIAAIWYNANEYAMIKAEYKTTLFFMECGAQVPAGVHCCRGLEYRSAEGARARLENKSNAYNAVLDEQEKQWRDDTNDIDALARVYLKHSTKCGKAALALGIRDEVEAKQIYSSESQADTFTKKINRQTKKMHDRIKKNLASRIIA